MLKRPDHVTNRNLNLTANLKPPPRNPKAYMALQPSAFNLALLTLALFIVGLRLRCFRGSGRGRGSSPLEFPHLDTRFLGPIIFAPQASFALYG